MQTPGRRGMVPIPWMQKPAQDQIRKLVQDSVQAQVQNHVQAQVTNPERAQVPNPVRAQVPNPVRAQVPNPVRAQVPNYVRPQVPNRVRPQVPNRVRPQVPNPVQSQVPNPVQAQLPNHVRPQVPNPVQAQVPNRVRPQVPNRIQAQTQNHVQAHVQTREDAQKPALSLTSVSDSEVRNELGMFSFDRCKRGNQGFQRLLLQLFGYAGHGKSSFINTCKTVWDNGPYKNYTNSSGSYGGDTTARMTYQLTENIIMVDNRGCSTIKSHETGEIYAQLANLLPLNKKVDWSKGFGLVDRIVEAEPLVMASDFIAPIFVYSATCSPNPSEITELKEILKNCREMTGVDATVVLTHRKKGDLQKTINMFRDMGAQNIFSLENYTPSNQEKSLDVHQLVMKFLYSVVGDVKFRAECPRDAAKEMGDRKCFVLNYLHTKDMEDHRRQLERQQALEEARMEQDRRSRSEDDQQQRIREEEVHRERLRRMEEDFRRQNLREQHEHEERMREIIKKQGGGNKK